MDYQVLFNILVALCGTLGGIILSMIRGAIAKLEADVRSMPVNYVAKQDYRNDLHDIKELLLRIEDKIDSKADKP